MKKGLLLVCGAYFSDDRIKFFDHKLHKPDMFDIIDVDWKSVSDGRKLKLPEADFVFVFGMKRLTRKLRKARNKPRKIQGLMQEFFTKNIHPKVPVGVLDDLNLGDEKEHGDFIRKMFFEKLNCKSFLLREYLSNRKYDKRVEPFSIPCVDYSHLFVPLSEKTCDVYFKGNDSSRGRRPVIQAVSKMGFKSSLDIYKGGEKSGKKISFDKYLKSMAKSKVCLTFDGAGFCCFRYQEIPSVGSLIAIPEYPFVCRNDYKDMESCIRFSSPKDLKNKLHTVLESDSLLNQMTAASSENFRKHHTNTARYQEFLDIINRSLI